MPRHSETRHLPYTPEQLFDLVADVARYDEFLPWVVAVRVRSSSEKETVADLVVGFNAFKERFTSRVVKERPEPDLRRLCRRAAQISPQRVAVRAARRTAAPTSHFSVDFAFKSRLFETLAGSMFDRALRRMTGGVRAARRGALRHQQLERAKRRLKANARAGLLVEELLVGDDLGGVGVALGAGENHGADRLLTRVPPPGPAIPVIATATSASDAASAPRAIAQAVATLTAPNVSTTSSDTLSSAILAAFE